MSIELLKVVSQILEVYFFFISHFSHNKDSPHVPRFDITHAICTIQVLSLHLKIVNAALHKKRRQKAGSD